MDLIPWPGVVDADLVVAPMHGAVFPPVVINRAARFQLAVLHPLWAHGLLSGL